MFRSKPYWGIEMDQYYGESEFYGDVDTYENWRQLAPDGELVELTPTEVAVYGEQNETVSEDDDDFIF